MNKENLEYLKKHYDNYIYPNPIEDIEEEFIKKKNDIFLTQHIIGIEFGQNCHTVQNN